MCFLLFEEDALFIKKQITMKIYSLETLGREHSLPVPVGLKNRYVTFKKESSADTHAFFSTPDKDLQEAIEASKFFESGGEIHINLVFSDETAEDKPSKKNIHLGPKVSKDEIEPAVFEEVTTYKEAKDILTGDVYKVAKTNKSLTSPEGILAKANELGISFPNLKAGE